MSQFWKESHNAGPTMWDVLRVWDRDPRPLRPTNRPRPTPFPPFASAEQLTEEHTSDVVHLWQRAYKGTDWTFRADPEWVHRLLQDPGTIVLGAFEGEHLVATIAARPLVPTGRIWIGTKAFQQAYMIEGLCVSDSWRGKHLAGWLIAWIDYVVNLQQPTPILWSREVASGIHGTDIALHTYAYLPLRSRLAQGTPSLPVVEVDPEQFQHLWATSSTLWVDPGAITVSHIAMDGLRVFESLREHRSFYVVVQDTQRQTAEGPIWEVAWCGYGEGGRLWPAKRTTEPLGGWKAMLEALCVPLANGLLFTTDAVQHGGAHTGWDRPWIFGASGHHATYMYGFMAPTFWSCALHWARREL